MFNKNCPECNNIVNYSTKWALQKSIKNNTLCALCRGKVVNGVKKCKECKEIKPIKEYYKSNIYKCKICLSKCGKVYYLINKNTIKDRVKKWNKTDNGKKSKKFEGL